MSIELLLQIHDCDQLVENSKKQLEEIPSQISELEKKILQEKETLQQWNTRHKQLEVSYRELEQEIKTADKKISQYQNQQETTFKQDALEALNNEIAALRTAVNNCENEALDLLLKIEQSESDTKEKTLHCEKETEKLQTRVNHLRLLEEDTRQKLSEQKNNFEQVSQTAGEGILKVYTKTKQAVKHPPYIVRMENQRCLGCHLRVSKEVWEKASLAKEWVNCDQCGRLVYIRK